jgi:hypothetical protein
MCVTSIKGPIDLLPVTSNVDVTSVTRGRATGPEIAAP